MKAVVLTSLALLFTLVMFSYQSIQTIINAFVSAQR